MKRIVADILGIDVTEVNERKTTDPKMRRALQLLGTEVGRDCLGENVWVNKLIRDIEHDEEYADAHGQERSHFVLTDVRFRNEFDAVKVSGFFMVYITCREEFKRLKGEAALHPSETDILSYLHDDKFDLVIPNNRTESADVLVQRILVAASEKTLAKVM